MLTRGCVGSVLVLLGGVVGATLPPSTQLLHWSSTATALQLLRGHEVTRAVALVVVLAGLALLASAWLRLCRWVATGPDGALEAVRWATVVWVAPLVLAPPLFSRDGWSYAAQGMLAHLGFSPYTHGTGLLTGPVVQAVDPVWQQTPTPYGPLPLVLGELFATQTGNPWLLVIGHRLVALLGLALLGWAVPRLAAWCGADPALATALVVASPLVLAHGVAGLHNDLLMVGLMACALVVAAERGWAWGAALGGLAAAVKLPGGLVCVAVALVTLPVAASLAVRARRLAAVALVAVGVLLGLGVVTGLGHGWVAGLAVPGSIDTTLSLTTDLGWLGDRVATPLGLAPGTLTGLVRTLGSVAGLALALAVALRWTTGSRRAAVTATAAIAAVLLLTAPVVHVWYLLWLLPFLAVQRLDRTERAALGGVCVVAGLVAPFGVTASVLVLAGLLPLGLAAPLRARVAPRTLRA